MRIGELARLSGLSRDTIRFYERHGLLTSYPSQEASNTYREYPDDSVERLAMVVEARESGLSIADLALLIRHMETDGQAAFDADAFFDEKIAEVKQTIEKARRFLAILKQAKAALQRAANDRPGD
jgi:DNA-binding transcriptional MerR regulator